MGFNVRANDPFLKRNEAKLEEFRQHVPLEPHRFELKHEPEETRWSCYAIFNKHTKEITDIAVNQVAIANRNSHFKVYDDFDGNLMQWAETHISHSEAKQIEIILYKIKSIDQLENWQDGVCQCQTCGTL